MSDNTFGGCPIEGHGAGEWVSSDPCPDCEIERLQRRIEELEAEVSLCETHHKPGHYISDKEIDAAWGLVQAAANLRLGSIVDQLLGVLKKFGIVGCEECDTAEKKRKWAMLRQQCPSCQKFTGNGWVIKEVSNE
jgi:NMD protein affecting ribosome stability and mRNA decay